MSTEYILTGYDKKGIELFKVSKTSKQEKDAFISEHLGNGEVHEIETVTLDPKAKRKRILHDIKLMMQSVDFYTSRIKELTEELEKL